MRFPDDNVSQRVSALKIETLISAPQSRLALVKTIVIHESGGDALAVSPTGCAGIGAICHKWFEACCKHDPDENGRYKKCDNEVLSGYLCDLESDSRFDPQFSVKYVNNYLNDIIDWTGVSTPAQIAMAYNAGPGFMSKLIKKTGPNSDLETLLENIRLEEMGYRNPGDEFTTQKMIEVHDYTQWVDTLMPYWRSVTQPTMSNSIRLAVKKFQLQFTGEYICYKREQDRWLIDRFSSYADSNICPQPETLNIYRLEFGEYKAGTAIWCRT